MQATNMRWLNRLWGWNFFWGFPSCSHWVLYMFPKGVLNNTVLYPISFVKKFSSLTYILPKGWKTHPSCKHPQEKLAKSGYRPDVKEEFFRNPSLFWLFAQSIIERWLCYLYFLQNMAIFLSFSQSKSFLLGA
jgi:hypothetical protein